MICFLSFLCSLVSNGSKYLSTYLIYHIIKIRRYSVKYFTLLFYMKLPFSHVTPDLAINRV